MPHQDQQNGPNTLQGLNFHEFAHGAIELMDHLHNPSEAETQTKVITPLLELLGWSRHSPRFRLEHAPVEGIPQRPDYLLLDESDNLRIAIEAKPWRSEMGSKEFNQIKSYLRIYNLKLGILTNGFTYHLFIRDDANSLTIPTPVKESLDSIHLDNSPIQRFRFEDNVTQTDNNSGIIAEWNRGTPFHVYSDLLVHDERHSIPKDFVYEIYKNTANRHGKDVFTRTRFWSELYDLGIQKDDVKRSRALTPGREREPGLLHYRLSEEGMEYLNDESKDHPCIQAILESL